MTWGEHIEMETLLIHRHCASTEQTLEGAGVLGTLSPIFRRIETTAKRLRTRTPRRLTAEVSNQFRRPKSVGAGIWDALKNQGFNSLIIG
jgi:hypothetical protein